MLTTLTTILSSLTVAEIVLVAVALTACLSLALGYWLDTVSSQES